MSTAGLLARAIRSAPDVRGRAGLARWVRQRTVDVDFEFDVRMRTGVWVTLPAGSAQAWRVAFTGRYDDSVIELLVGYAEPGSVVLDIGASLGLYSVGLASRLPGCEVIAIEPIPTNGAVIHRMVDRNGLHNVSILPTALGSTPGRLQLAVEGAVGGNAAVVSGLSTAEQERHRVGLIDAVVDVPVQRLDDVDLPARRCSLIKMDVEGFEMEVLRGASEFLVRHRPTIYGEFSGPWLRSRGERRDAVRTWAAANSYRVRGVDRRPGRLRVGGVAVVDRDVGDDLLLTPV